MGGCKCKILSSVTSVASIKCPINKMDTVTVETQVYIAECQVGGNEGEIMLTSHLLAK